MNDNENEKKQVKTKAKKKQKKYRNYLDSKWQDKFTPVNLNDIDYMIE